MEAIEVKSPEKVMIDKMIDVEKVMSKWPDIKFGDDAAPLRHFFGDNLYIREITMEKGMLILSKIHKTTHPYFVMSGHVAVLTGDGMAEIQAPFCGITPAGTQRLLYIREETIWITVHSTSETDLEKIEDQIIAKTFDELPEAVKAKGELI